MTTITIKNGELLTQTEFDSLDDLREYLYSQELLKLEFTDDFQEEISVRSEQLRSGKVQGVSLKEIQKGMAARIRK